MRRFFLGLLTSFLLLLPHATAQAPSLAGAVFTPQSVILLDGKAVELKDLPAETTLVDIQTKTVILTVVEIVNGQQVTKQVPEIQVVLFSVRSK